jgi:G3E family GTPase
MNLDVPKTGPGRARYIMLGGFLGAGKTTSVARLGQWLSGRGHRVGLITNDQGSELVDTTLLRSMGFSTQEIPGGCFCCRFNSLLEAAGKLERESAPDIFIGEPVGSCTDLVATVTYPLRRIYGDRFAISPLSVLVDPVRALRVLDCEPGGKFTAKVLYIYRKQLEEADFIVVNKCDLLDEPRYQALTAALTQEFPKARLFKVSARNGDGLEQWFTSIMASEQAPGQAMQVDYDLYADGEALLGWLNATVAVSSVSEFDGNALIRRLADELHQCLSSRRAEIAHLKMTLSPNEGLGDLAVVNLVRNDFVPELMQELSDPMENGQLVVNLRAEAEPAVLQECLRSAIEACQQGPPAASLKVEHLEFFKPGRPTPTHRLAGST